MHIVGDELGPDAAEISVERAATEQSRAGEHHGSQGSVLPAGGSWLALTRTHDQSGFGFGLGSRYAPTPATALAAAHIGLRRFVGESLDADHRQNDDSRRFGLRSDHPAVTRATTQFGKSDHRSHCFSPTRAPMDPPDAQPVPRYSDAQG